MPHIAKAYHIDPMNPLESIDAGANLMNDLISRFHRDDKMCTTAGCHGQVINGDMVMSEGLSKDQGYHVGITA